MSQVRDGWSTAGSGGADQGTVRRANLSLVLRSLREGGARSRARLAADLGLNKATVSSLVTELRERGLVREGSAERGAVGRPGTIVEIDGAGAYGLGAEINVHHVSTRAVDLAGDRRQRAAYVGGHPRPRARRGGRPAGRARPRHAGRPGRARRGPGRRRSWEWPGLVDHDRGTVSVAANLGWQDVALASLLRDAARRPRLPPRGGQRGQPRRRRRSHRPATPSAATSSSSTARSASVAASSPTAGRSPDGAATPASSATWSSTATATGAAAVAPGAGRPSSVSAACIELAAAGEDDLLRSPVLDLEGKVEEISRRAAAGDERTLAALQRGRPLGRHRRRDPHQRPQPRGDRALGLPRRDR